MASFLEISRDNRTHSTKCGPACGGRRTPGLARIRTALAIGLIFVPWQALLTAEADISEAIRAELELLRESGRSSVPGSVFVAVDRMAGFYERRAYAAAWAEPGKVDSLLRAIRESWQDGLNPADYHLQRIAQLQEDLRTGRALSVSEQGAFDLILTDGLMRLADDRRYGKLNPDTLNSVSTLVARQRGTDTPQDIEAIIDAESISAGIDSVAASGADYHRLKTQLRRHRELADAGGWPEVPAGPTIRPGVTDSRLAALAERLSASGDLASRHTLFAPSAYDETLQDAVRNFQARHGLETDVLVGPATLRALNVPLAQRIDQIRINLERARWTFDLRGDDFVEVNIPGFRASMVRDGRVLWTTKVIVGATGDETPEFRAALKHIVFNPTWTVPFSIASEEHLPQIKRDPDFLARGHYDLFDQAGNMIDPSAVDWSGVGTRNFPFTVIQRPGPLNQLGRIKFVFPNEYAVFMHDTPARYLFDKPARAFSHGCVRVDKPMELAEILLGQDGWPRDRIQAAIDTGTTRTVVLSESLPILLLYRTAEVDDSGTIRFYEDIYGRDRAVLEALDRPL